MVEADDSEPTSNQLQNDPGVMMEEIADILKLLNYEELFLSTKGFKPLTRAQFSAASNNPSDQFQYFTSLVS